MTRYLWLSVSVCCAAALWSACGPPPNSCQVSADCFPDEVCVSNLCVPKPSEDGGTEVADAGTGGGDGTTGGGDGTQSGGGSATGGGSAVGGGDPTGGGQGVDAGMPDCEAGDTLPCCSGRGVQTCDSDGTWSACDATVSSESCNGIDDDCNGTVDNDVLFSMPDGGVAMNVTCTIGVGACESSGSLACATDGGVVCGAAVIEGTTEICDDIDNDCDGEVDEGTKVLCMIDFDNDHYAGSAMQQEFCPDNTRPTFGNCPVGYVATSQGADCNDNDPSGFIAIEVRVDADGDKYCTAAQAISKCTNGLAPTGYTPTDSCNLTVDCDDTTTAKYQNIRGRPDADMDGACFGAEQDVCSGAQLPSTFRSPADCATKPEDCDPTNPSAFRNASVRTDNDNDNHCVGIATTKCIGTGTYYAPSHDREATSCTTPDDCDDSTAALYQSLSTMYADADNDYHCTGSAVTKCVGSTGIIPGFKEATWCADKTDCDDTLASGGSVYRLVTLRSDADNDYYCKNDAANYCIGNSVPTDKRISCDGTDCNDNNRYAGASCSQTIYSNTYTKVCPGMYTTTNWDFSWSCPAGFHSSAAQFVDDNWTDGDQAFYTAQSYNLNNNTAHSDFTCNFLASGTDYFKVAVTCTDNATAP